MSRNYYLFFFLCLVCIYHSNAQTQTNFKTIPLSNLDAFDHPGSNWTITGGATADISTEGIMHTVPGTGTVVNLIAQKNNTHLVTRERFGDIELELDFMMPKGSNSGIYLQGRYEVQLFDSWGNIDPTYADCGGIYQRWDDKRQGNTKGYEGMPPLMNTTKAPGLWQHVHIKFRAPRFDSQGKKTENARFEEVFLNGVLIQQQVEVTGPTRAAAYEDEQPEGPIMLQGDHGNVAFRNISYRPLTGQNTTPPDTDLPDPIIVKAVGRPYLLRSFINYKDKLLTHGISVGDPKQVNYSYDMKQGALFQVWRGQFANATDLWHERGEPYQRIVPMGSVIVLSDAPALAVLPDVNTTQWPQAIAFDDIHNKGYTLDAARSPLFKYSFNNMNVADKITVPDATGLTRSITVTNAPADLYIRVAVGKKIESIGKELYTVDDRQFYVAIGDKLKSIIRQSGSNQELLIPVKSNEPVTYSLIW